MCKLLAKILVIVLFVGIIVNAKPTLANQDDKPKQDIPQGIIESYQILRENKKDLRIEEAQDSLHGFDVLEYKIRLYVNTVSNTLTGHVTALVLNQTNSRTSLGLHMGGMVLDSAKVNSSSATFSRVSTNLTVNLPSPSDAGETLSVDLFYSGTPTRGFYFSTTKYGNPIYYSFAEPSDARYWFPGYDEPWDKALAELWVNVPNGLIVASNGNLLDVQTDIINNRLIYHWKEHYPIATYLISLAITDYAELTDYYYYDSDSMPVKYFVYKPDTLKAWADFENVPDMIGFYSTQFGQYPFITEKYGMAQAPFGGAMEHQTITTYGQNLIRGDKFYEWIAAHELSHHWWGDLVTCNDWKNIWLNEGFATYSDALYKQYKYGETAFQTRMNDFAQQYFSEDLSRRYPIYNPPSGYLFGAAEYEKGAWVLHMLRHLIGETNFWNGLKQYAINYAYGTANTEQFRQTIESVSGQALSWFFNLWIYQAGYPIYQYKWVALPYQGKYTVYINVQQTQTNAPIFQMPVDFKISFASGDTTFTVQNDSLVQEYILKKVSQQPTGVTLDYGNWILKKTSLVPYSFVHGDATGDNMVTTPDLIFLINYIFKRGPLPAILPSGDVNGDGNTSLADIVYLINYLYKSGPPPV